MAEAAAAGAAVFLLKKTVGGLLKELVAGPAAETARAVLHRNKNYQVLLGLLNRVEPVVSSITPQTASPATRAWLEDLERSLEGVKDALNEFTGHSGWGVKMAAASKRLLKETKQIRDLFQESSIVVLQCSAATSEAVRRLPEQLEEINQQLEAVQLELRRRDLGHATRKVLETPICNFGVKVGVTTVSDAVREIKDQADSVAWTTSSLGLEPRPEPEPLLRRQDSLTVFGGDQVVKDVMELLLSDGDNHWAGLWAVGGAGKTLTAQRAFNDPSIQAHFDRSCYWLTVGRDQPAEKLLRNLRFVTTGAQDRWACPLPDLKNLLAHELKDREKMLLVLDDVWDEALLDWLDVLPHKLGCKTLVTTRNSELLDRKHAPKCHVPLLSPEHSWQLFCWHAFRGVQNVPRDLRDIANRICMEECRGLPLALKVIAGVFAGKTDLGYWQLSLEKLRNAEVLTQQHEEKLYLRLKLSVDELPGLHSHLKDCFFYFAAFPEDAEVRVVEDLLPLWTGEGIVGSHGGYDPKDEACELLGWLISRSLVELHSDRSSMNQELMICKVHDVLRDMARYILQHKLVATRRECLYEAGRELKSFPAEWAAPGKGSGTSGKAVPLAARRMSVMGSNLKDLPQKMLLAPALRVLILSNNPLQSLPESFCHSLQNLKVLDLRRTSISSFPSAGLANLKRLVVLNLSSNPELLTLPHSVGYLASLQQLNLWGCSKLKSLPSSLSLLTRLQSFMFEGQDVWAKSGAVPRWVSKKASLQDLTSWVSLKELRISSEFHGPRALPSHLLTALKELVTVRLTFPDLTSFPEPAADDELQRLEYLSLRGCTSLTALPSSLGSLSRLARLDLGFCSGVVSLPALDALPSLVYLNLHGCTGLRSLPGSFGRRDAFPALKELWMFDCHRVASFPDLKPGAMPQLLILHLDRWRQLLALPKSLANLTNLRCLELAGCPSLHTWDYSPLAALPNLEELKLDRTVSMSQLPQSVITRPNFRLHLVEVTTATTSRR